MNDDLRVVKQALATMALIVVAILFAAVVAKLVIALTPWVLGP